jgi:hypothetical protein
VRHFDAAANGRSIGENPVGLAGLLYFRPTIVRISGVATIEEFPSGFALAD